MLENSNLSPTATQKLALRSSLTSRQCINDGTDLSSVKGKARCYQTSTKKFHKKNYFSSHITYEL